MRYNFTNMKKRKGFTLAETVMAMAVVGLLMTTFMMVLVPSRNSINSSIAIQEADRLTSALTAELAVLRDTERQKYNTAFEKAFDWMQKTKAANTSILVYNYRGDLSQTARQDGSLKPYKGGRNYEPGADTMVTTAVILAEQDRQRIEEDAPAIVGPVFVVRMTQLVWDSQSRGRSSANMRAGTQYGGRGGRYILADRPGTIANPYQPSELKGNAQSYMYDPDNANETPWGAEVLYMAEFFQLPVLQSNAIRNLTYEKLKRPLFTRNLSFRR